MAKAHNASPTAAKKKLAELEGRIKELESALQQERADAINIRRRHDEELANLRDRIKAAILTDLLPVIDNFERALKVVPKELENNDYVKGVRSVVKQFEKTIEGFGIERIETVGAAFDPKFHEAVSVEEGDGSTTQEVVTEELQPGYRLGDRVIRHAMVKVRS